MSTGSFFAHIYYMSAESTATRGQLSGNPSGLYKVVMHVLTLSHFTFRRAHLAHDLDDRGRLDVGATPNMFKSADVNV
jgi:hypothetical protein